MAFPKRLKMLIKERKLTQKQIADALGIPASTFSGYVQGYSEPSLDTLIRLADYFKVSADYLLGIPSPCIQDATEEDLLRVFRTLSPDDRTLYLEEGKVIIRIKYTRKKDNVK